MRWISYYMKSRMPQTIDLDKLLATLVEETYDKPKMTVLCGGTGSSKIIKELQNYFDVSVLINAYDDGKSTGRIREAFDMLGPSDIVKNLTTLLDENKFPGLKLFMEYRCINNNLSDNSVIREEISYILNDSLISMNNYRREKLLELYYGIEKDKIMNIKDYFYRFYNDMPKTFDLRDIGVRNIVFTGCFLKNNRDYEKTIDELEDLFEVRTKIILNSFEDRKLIGLMDDGTLLPSEHEIIEYIGDSKINELFAVGRKSFTKDHITSINNLKNYDEKYRYIKQNFNTKIKANENVVSYINKSKIIVFGPTTYNSSLLPTLITERISETIKQNDGIKVMIPNLIKESEDITVSYFPKTLKERYDIDIDYILISNSIGHLTDDFIAVDASELQKYGKVIKADFYGGFGAHRPDCIANVICQLYLISKKRINET